MLPLLGEKHTIHRKQLNTTRDLISLPPHERKMTVAMRLSSSCMVWSELVEGGHSLQFVCISPSRSLFSPTAAPVTVSQFILTQRDDSSLSVSWLAPRQRSRTSVEYEVMFFEKVRPAWFALPPFSQRGGSVLLFTMHLLLVWFLQGEEARYTVKHLLEPNVTLRDLQPDTAYLLRVRSITPLGPGPYSPEQEFRTLPPGKGWALVFHLGESNFPIRLYILMVHGSLFVFCWL